MLKTRIVAVLIVRNGIVVQSFDFARYLPVGSPAIAIEYLDRWGIDEIVVLDIDATAQGRPPRFDHIREYSKHCHVPLAVGGGISTIDDISQAVYAGADKIVINSAALSNPELISKGAELFGNQCVVVSIDARQTGEGSYEVFAASGTEPTGNTPAMLARIAEDYGAGEIFLTAIHRDGTGTGLDLALIETVMDAVEIPVVICGGVRHPKHFEAAMALGVSGVAAANFFHHSEHSVLVNKSYLKAAGQNVRLDSYVTYDTATFDRLGRVNCRDDAFLDKLHVTFMPEEVI